LVDSNIARTPERKTMSPSIKNDDYTYIAPICPEAGLSHAISGAEELILVYVVYLVIYDSG